MATDEEVEKAKDRVAELRQKLATAESSSVDTEANNDVTMYELNREADSLKAQISEAEAIQGRQHENARNPMEFAAAMLTREDSKSQPEDMPEVKKVATKSDSPDGAVPKSERKVN